MDFSAADLVAEKVWYDASSGRLCLSAAGYQNGILLAKIPDSDFDSAAPISRFSLGQSGTVVVCHHKDGAESWLPVDLWLPEGFTLKPDR
ncbi:MAG: hypothetical protein JNK23_16685 [Opitutaceae bacterium]|nr:hypothetical protein [Opitutaceae bacterium]